MTQNFSKQKGIGLIEIIICLAIIMISFWGFLNLLKFNLRIQSQKETQTKAVNLATEAIEASRAVRDENWSAFAALTINTKYYPVATTKWTLTASNPGVIESIYSRWLIIENVYRDSNDNISPSGALDANTRKVTVYVQWPDRGITQQTTLTAYLTNWR